MSRNLSLALKSLPGGTRTGNERRVIEHVPYAALIAPDIIETVEGDLVAIIKLRGVSHQTADTASLNAWLASRAHVIQTISSPDIGLYYTYIRRRVDEYPHAEFTNDFARNLDNAWAASIAQRKQYIGEHYLSVILRTRAEKSFGIFKRKAASGSEGRAKAMTRGPASDAIASHRISFGQETIEFRGTTSDTDRLATIVSVKEYTPETAPGMLDASTT